MSRYCDCCGRGPMSGNNVSHSNRHTRRKWNINVQSVRTIVNGEVRRMKVCAKCLRSNRVQRAV